ncbi:1-(5-phosphoribosyl)-5-[(5-phosphoribosylamino)methylideneamino] imidazole-4-carboxamide isomerase [Gaiella sp.]|uniref:1-(5-phosphoribosyl)-5-[(5- phosphoribosylamino)methylideneamino]imidazole-4- carboxamide isomerase n=1 Tax=Gaiella sp. TaxID=2663207 RepID=UPI0032637403
MLTQEFDVIPAIDVLEGRVVRLAQGRREAVTIEGGDPVELARRFRDEGARRLHLVDLDGAFSGTPTLDLVERVARAGGLPLQVGGGYRTPEVIASALDAGADRVMVGTAALSPCFLANATDRFGARLVVAIDSRDGKVAVDGWTRTAEATPADFARDCARAGVARLLVTSTARDGSLAGPDVELLADVLTASLPVIAAGGISSLEDLLAVRGLGCESAIAGSALLAGRFTLVEARARLAQSDEHERPR